MKKLVAIEIHDIQLNTVKRIHSGDNKAWKRLDIVDRSFIRMVVSRKTVMTCGKIVYHPIFEEKRS